MSEEKTVFSSAKRKTSKAFTFLKPGSGIIRVNGAPIECYWPNKVAVMRVMEPLLLAEELSKKVDIKIKVKGGGYMSQADAVRTSIARALVKYSGSEDLKKKFLEYDRFLLVEDYRRTEPKKYGGRSARARVQKSYR